MLLNNTFVLSFALAFCFGYAACQVCNVKHESQEKKLHKELLCDYIKDMRPRRNSQDTVNVTVGMILKTFGYSYEFSSIGMVNIGSWVILNWQDDFLTWNPDSNGGIKETIIHSSKIWTPDLSLYNNSPWRGGVTAPVNAPCRVSSTGAVTCRPHMAFSGVCTSNYKRWPYDEQNCTLTFGTWMQRGEEVSFHLNNTPALDVRGLEPNKFWQLMQSGASRHDGKFDCCPNNTYPTVSFWINIQRHAASAVTYILTPAIVMIALTLSSLWLDLGCLERLMLMLLNVYIHILYIKKIASLVPGNGDTVPNAGIYFRDSTLLSCAVLLEGIALRALTKKKTGAPHWISVVTAFMKTGAGKIIMYHEFDPATSAMVPEDAETLSKEEVESATSNEWLRFALFANRIFFIIVCITYIILFLKYLL